MILLNLSIFLFGWLISYAMLAPLGNWIATAFAPVAGWLLAGVFSLAGHWIGLGPQYCAVGVWGGLALSNAVLWWALRPPMPKKSEVVATFLGFGACLGTCLAARFFDFHTFSPDNFAFVMLGNLVARAGEIRAGVASAFLDYGSLPIIWQGFAVSVGADYLYTMAPVLAVSLLAAIATVGPRLWASSTGKGFDRTAAATMACVLVLTTPLFLLHSQSVHSILPASLFAFWFWASALLYFQERHGQWLAAAFVALTGLTLCRVEGPLYAAFFLTLLFSDERLPARHFIRGFHPYATVIAAYYLVLAAHFVDHFDRILEPKKIALMLAPFAVLFVLSILAVAGPKNWNRYRSKLAPLSFGVLGVGTLVYISWMPDHLGKALTWSLFNLFQMGGWGFTSITVLMCALWMSDARPASWEPLLWKAMGGFVCILYLFGAFRLPYRPGPGDTANRLFLVIFPLVLLALMGRWAGMTSNRAART